MEQDIPEIQWINYRDRELNTRSFHAVAILSLHSQRRSSLCHTAYLAITNNEVKLPVDLSMPAVPRKHFFMKSRRNVSSLLVVVIQLTQCYNIDTEL